jgi:hypothetical protein
MRRIWGRNSEIGNANAVTFVARSMVSENWRQLHPKTKKLQIPEFQPLKWVANRWMALSSVASCLQKQKRAK